MAEVWLRSFSAALPTVRRAHTDDEVRSWFAHVVVPNSESWVAEERGSVVGLLVLDGAELTQLYLDPPQRGRGLGDQLVDLAKRRRRTAWSCGPSRSTARRGGSTSGTGSSPSSTPTGGTTRSGSRTSGMSGRRGRRRSRARPARRTRAWWRFRAKSPAP
ncbi:GNAT family N-acetyltransferase [Saccharopolyspora hirsuta]|nr:GNAT family N-acetyltransferase [Saccharopolyspora hirsuta]